MLADAISQSLRFELGAQYCSTCRLRQCACCCHLWAQTLNSSLNLGLLLHPLELAKPSNTSMLVWRALAGTQLQLWQRKGAIIERSTEQKPVLLLPASVANRYQGVAEQPHPMVDKASLTGRRFLLIDGTWQQVKKIYRQSPELQQLAVYELYTNDALLLDEFSLRRKQVVGGFCTAQAVALLLQNLGQAQAARDLHDRYQNFCQHVLASRNNHGL